MSLTVKDIEVIDEKIEKSHKELLEFANAAIISRIEHLTSSGETKASILEIRAELKSKVSWKAFSVLIVILMAILSAIWAQVTANGRSIHDIGREVSVMTGILTNADIN